MIPASSTLRAAIDSPARQPVLRVILTLGGTDYTFESGTDQDMVTGYSLSRTPQEQAIRASQISGTIAAQCNFTLRGWQAAVDGDFLSSSDLSVYKSGLDALRDNDYGIDAPVRVLQGYHTSEGIEVLPVFSGFVDRIAVADDDSVSFLCLDQAGRLQNAEATTPYRTVKTAVQSLAEQILRSGGYFRTPPVVGDCLLSVPSIFPEIGISADERQAATPDNVYPWFSPYVFDWYGFSLCHDSQYDLDRPLTVSPGNVIAFEARINNQAANEDASLWVGNFGFDITFSNVLRIGSRFGTKVSTGVVIPAAVAVYPAEYPQGIYTGSCQIYVEVTRKVTGFDWFVSVDGTSYSGSSSTDVTWPQDDSRVHLGSSPFEGLQIRAGDTETFERVVRTDWVPNYETVWEGTTDSLTVAIPQTGRPWDILQAMANARLSRARWSESGEFVWTTRAALAEQRFSTAASAIDDSRVMISSGFEYERASRLSKVSTAYSPYIQLVSNQDVPIFNQDLWSATEVITVRANRVETMEFETDLLVRYALGMGSTATPHLSSQYTAVPADQVGDPAARTVRGLRFTVRPKPGALQVTVENPHTMDIAFWDPATAAPALLFRGLAMTQTTSRHVSVASSLKSTESLELAQSNWLQDDESAQAIVEAIASEAALPAIVFNAQQTVGDPTRVVGDVVSIHASGLMDDPVPCVIIGKDSDMDEDTLTVVPCWPPTGWVLGITGRSELGSVSTATAIIVA